MVICAHAQSMKARCEPQTIIHHMIMSTADDPAMSRPRKIKFRRVIPALSLIIHDVSLNAVQCPIKLGATDSAALGPFKK